MGIPTMCFNTKSWVIHDDWMIWECPLTDWNLQMASGYIDRYQAGPQWHSRYAHSHVSNYNMGSNLLDIVTRGYKDGWYHMIYPPYESSMEITTFCWLNIHIFHPSFSRHLRQKGGDKWLCALASKQGIAFAVLWFHWDDLGLGFGHCRLEFYGKSSNSMGDFPASHVWVAEGNES